MVVRAVRITGLSLVLPASDIHSIISFKSSLEDLREKVSDAEAIFIDLITNQLKHKRSRPFLDPSLRVRLRAFRLCLAGSYSTLHP